jgi:hypothetical protein
MIYSDTHRFFFVHIPKNAGTTVRRQLLSIDGTCSDFKGREAHAQLGRIFKTHLTLKQMRDHFPALYRKAIDYDAFAILREPHERFVSALRQYLLEFEQTNLQNMAPIDQRSAVLRVLDRLAGRPEDRTSNLVHFTPQTAYVYADDGKQVVENLYLMDDVSALLRELSNRTGTSLRSNKRANESVTFRAGWMARPIYRLNRILKKNLPTALHDRIKVAGKAVVAERSVGARSQEAFLDLPEVRSFVTDHYAPDLTLYGALARTRRNAV